MASLSRVLIADDHTLFRRGLRLLLGNIFSDIEVVEAADVVQALKCLEGGATFDLLLLDLAMPGMEDFVGLERLRAAAPELPIIMLSAVTSVASIAEAIRRGARGYILKSCSDESLKHAISLVLCGETFIPAQVLTDLQAEFAASGPQDLQALSPESPLGALTERQLDVVALLMEGQSNKEIARHLGLLESTVKAHVKVILGKLNASNRTQAAMVAATLGMPVARGAALGRPGLSGPGLDGPGLGGSEH